MRSKIYFIVCAVIVSLPVLDIPYLWGLFGQDMLHQQIQDRLFVYSQNIMVLAFAYLAFSLCRYERLILKVVLFMLLLWRVTVLCLNCLNLDDNSAFLIPTVTVLGTVLLSYALRFAFTGNPKGVEAPDDGNAFYGLVPVHTWAGFAQSLLIPWNNPRYESRMVVQGDTVWMVYKGTFVEFNSRKYVKTIKGATWLPLGRKLSRDEVAEIRKLSGKIAITGIKDCRRLMVAGRPGKYFT